MSSDTQAYDPKFYETFYHLTPREKEFFLAQTGIKDEEELKRHIMSVQEDALKVVPNRTPNFVGTDSDAFVTGCSLHLYQNLCFYKVRDMCWAS